MVLSACFNGYNTAKEPTQCLIPLPIHTITSGINRIVVQHTERAREAMSDKRLWHRKSSLKPEKRFEMKEKIGYIEQGEKIKEKKGNWKEQE